MASKSKTRGTPKKRSRDKPKRKPLRSRARLPSNKQRGFLETALSLWKVFFVTLSAIAAVGTLYALSPRMTVSSLSPLDPSKLFTTPFTILNDGYLMAHNVQATCFASDVKDTNGYEFRGLRFVDTETQDIGDLHPKEPATLPCAFVSNFETAPIARASITIDVTYRPDFYPWRMETRFRFVTASGPDGQLHWQPQPVGSERTKDAPSFIRIHPSPSP